MQDVGPVVMVGESMMCNQINEAESSISETVGPFVSIDETSQRANESDCLLSANLSLRLG